MSNKFLKYQRGLSLIEVLTAFAIFGILSVSLMAIFTASVNTQTVILQNQSIMNESNFALDYMGRVIRLAIVDDQIGGLCTGTENNNYGQPGGTSEIVFLAWDPAVPDLGGTCQRYRCRKFTLTGNKIVEYKSKDCSAVPSLPGTGFPASGTEITSNAVRVTGLNFNIVGAARSDSVQPKVTISLEMETTGRRIEPIPKIRVQTSMSQRNLNLE